MKQHRLTSGVTAKFDLFMELISEDDDSMLGKHPYTHMMIAIITQIPTIMLTY